MRIDGPIKILHIIGQIGIGGAERQLCMLVANSSVSGQVMHEVVYYGDSNDSSGLELYRSHHIFVTRIPRKKWNPLSFFWNLSWHIRQTNPDIVHCWLVSANFWGRLAALAAGQRHIVTAWRSSMVWNQIGLRLIEMIAPHKVHHLANSRACARMVAKAIGISPDQFEVVYNGVDMGLFDVPAKREAIYKGLDIPENFKIITMVGRLTEAKNYPMLLHTARRCKDQSMPVNFIIVGHGEKEAELKALASELNINDVVHFLGLRMDIPDILKTSDIFCFTSWYEGFPNALLEAMAAKLPVIVTDFDGVRELVNDSIVGTVVPHNNVPATYEAIKRYLEDAILANTISVNAKELVRLNFDVPIMVKKSIKFYQDILNR